MAHSRLRMFSCALSARIFNRIRLLLSKGPKNERNISTQHLATLLDRVVKELAKRPQHVGWCWIKFENGQIWSNTIRATMLQDVALECCVRLAGPFIRAWPQPYVVYVNCHCVIKRIFTIALAAAKRSKQAENRRQSSEINQLSTNNTAMKL